jgi:putative transcriptional regulator
MFMDGKLEENAFTSFKGHFLISMPALADPNFSKTVTCICEHTPAGALGLIVNRPHPLIKIEQIFNEFKIPVCENFKNGYVYMGGPVQIDEIFILHGAPFEWNSTMKITSELALSNTIDILETMAGPNKPSSSIMMLGCAGWGPGQLEQEIMENAWLTNPVSEEIIFNTPVEERWDEAVKMLGIDPLLLASTAGNA